MNTGEPVQLEKGLADAFGIESEVQEQVQEEVSQEVVTQEVAEEVTQSEQVQEEVVTEEEEIEIPEISTQVVEATEKKEPEQKTTVSKKLKVPVFKDKFQAALYKYTNSVENPDLAAFERAFKSDYEKLTPVEAIRAGFESDPINKGKPKWFIDRLVNEKLDEFDLNSDDDNEKQYAELKLEREADKIKAELVRTGKEFISQFEADLEIEVDTEVENEEPVVDEAALLAQRDAYKAEFAEGFSKVVQDGVIQMKDSVSGSVINIPATDVKDLAELALTFQSKFQNPDGTANYQKLAQFLNYVNNEDAVHSAWFKHGYTSASKKITSQLKNKVDLANPRPVGGSSNVTLESDPIEFLKGLKVVNKN